MKTALALVVLALAALVFALPISTRPSSSLNFPSTVGYKVVEPSGYTVLAKGENGGTLYSVDADDDYNDPVMLIDLHGSRYGMGFDFGLLLAKQAEATYDNLLTSILGTKWYRKAAQNALQTVLDWQWNSYLSVELPADYKEELRGFEAGATKAGFPGSVKNIQRGVALANLPGDLKDFIDVLKGEFGLGRVPSDVLAATAVLDEHFDELASGWTGLHCSMFAIWGSRTEGDRLFTARNLDWAKDTGIQQYKLVTVYHPDNGFAHVTLGYAGMFGALAGMSAKGLTVHEANLEEPKDTFLGFPWLLRLRYIMENAVDLSSARKLWEGTNNTVGFNHMVGSAPDVVPGQKSHAAMVMETMMGYTAYFYDNDKREADRVCPDKSGQEVHTGAPMEEALWRTNHGYDPQIVKDFLDPQSPESNSVRRYFYIHDAFVDATKNNQRLTTAEAVNVTAIVAAKGKDAYHCQPAPQEGTNVLSVMFSPSDLELFVAWENGSDQTWTSAACNSYLKLDMTKWF